MRSAPPPRDISTAAFGNALSRSTAYVITRKKKYAMAAGSTWSPGKKKNARAETNPSAIAYGTSERRRTLARSAQGVKM